MMKTTMTMTSRISGMLLGFLAASAAFAATPAPIEVALKNGKGEDAGTVKLTEVKDGVLLSIRASDLTPGKHGIHFHESGKCEGPDFKSAGSHFNPSKKHHGAENPQGPHLGDLPNLNVGADGKSVSEIKAPGVTLVSGANALLAKGDAAFVIHAKADDLKSDPSGDSGDRVVCGVIKSTH